MKRLLTVGLLALMTTPAFAGDPVRNFATTYSFPNALEQARRLQTALAIEFQENGGYKAVYNTYNTENFKNKNVSTSMSIGNWSSISCSGDSYCNADQENDDSVQNAQVNTGEDVKANQVGDDQTNKKGGGKYANY